MGGYVNIMDRIHTPKGEFHGLTTASRHNNICKDTLRKRLQSKDPEYASYFYLAKQSRVKNKRSQKNKSVIGSSNLEMKEILDIADSIDSQDIANSEAGLKSKATRESMGKIKPDSYFVQFIEAAFQVPDREYGFSNRTAKIHNIDLSTMCEVVNKGTRGGKPIIPVEEFQKKLEKWRNEIATKFIVYTPGIELLPAYDDYNNKYLGKSVASRVPPSAIYDLRYNCKNPSVDVIKDRLKKYFPKNAKRDTSSWRRELKKFPFLSTKKSKMFVFFQKEDVYVWLNENYGTNLGKKGKRNGGKGGLAILKKTKDRPFGVAWTTGKLRGLVFQTKEAKDKYLI